MTEKKNLHASATVHISGLENIMKDIMEKVYESNGKIHEVHEKVEDIKDLVKHEGKNLT